MEHRFALPIAIAAALHLGLLFGIPHTPGSRANHGAEKLPPLPPLPPIPIDLVFRDSLDEKAAPAKSTADEPRPPSPEPPVTENKATFTIEVPPASPVRPDRPVTKIGDFGPGVPGGRRDGVGFDPNTMVRDGDLDAPPRARVQVPPAYPHEQRKLGIGGEVIVEFAVDESGAVHSPRVVRSTDRAFEEPTLRAVARWRFEPGRRDGRIVRFRMAVPVVFKLDSD